MLRNKYFWIALVIFVPFVIVWIMEGLAWAIGMLVAIGFLLLIISGSARRRRRTIYYDGDEEDYDEEIVVRRPRRPSPSSFDTARKWHIPTVDRKGVEFLTGASNLRKRQERDMKRIRKNLGR